MVSKVQVKSSGLNRSCMLMQGSYLLAVSGLNFAVCTREVSATPSATSPPPLCRPLAATPYPPAQAARQLMILFHAGSGLHGVSGAGWPH